MVDAAVATMVPRTQAILRALRRRCLSGSRAAIALTAHGSAAQRCCRAARRRNRWSSQSLLMRRWRRTLASASMRALSRVASKNLAAENPCRRVFSRIAWVFGRAIMPREALCCYHYTLSDGGGDDGVSRAASAARASCSSSSISVVSGCWPPSTRRAVRSVSSSVVTALRRLSSVAPSSS